MNPDFDDEIKGKTLETLMNSLLSELEEADEDSPAVRWGQRNLYHPRTSVE